MALYGPDVQTPGWFSAPALAPLSTEAIGLHFVSWSWASLWPKWRGHCPLYADKYLLRPKGRSRLISLRAELVKAGLRRPCEDDGYKLCDETCQVLVGFDPVEMEALGRAASHAARLRAEARILVPVEDRIACVECGAVSDLTVDHTVPIVKGGGNDLGNLRVLCRSCNSRKGARF